DALKKLYVTEGRWDDLEKFYRDRGKIDEYIRVLEREVESGSDTHRLELAMKIAVLYRDELQKADRAMRAFEKVLSLDENNLAAAEALIPLYEQGRDLLALDERNEQALDALDRLYLGKGRYEDLMSVYAKKLDLTNNADERIAIQSKVGQLYEDEIKDDQKAIGAYLAILDVAGDELSA